MKNSRKKIATVTKEEAIKELTDAFLEDGYRSINDHDDMINWFIELCDEGEFNEVSSFEEYLEKSESEQNEILKKWIFNTLDNHVYLTQILEEKIAKDKNLSDREKEIYYDVFDDVVEKSSSDKQFLETIRRKINKQEENVNPDFNKGMNKTNCIRIRLQKKLS